MGKLLKKSNKLQITNYMTVNHLITNCKLHNWITYNYQLHYKIIFYTLYIIYFILICVYWKNIFY